MNNGKICVSVCAETADEIIEQIRRAENFADVIEIRFDCLVKVIKLNQLFGKFEKLKHGKPWIVTYRPREQGGNNPNLTNDDLLKRETFFHEFKEFVNFEFIDCEHDFFQVGKEIKTKEIRSFHNFENNHFISSMYDSIVSTNPNIIKIAVHADDITDSLAIWQLLKKAKSENKQIIPIAMGEAGKWTRILGLAHGAFMTYAALDAGKETASGQISAQDLIETYRVKELDEQTEIYGIIGNPVAQSLSPFMHNAAFKFYNLNAVYIPFEVKNLDEFIGKFLQESGLDIKGFSVTIPHKQAIIKHLDFIDETAKAIGAVNTVKIYGGKLHGYNTDADGFIVPLQNAYGDLKNAKVAVLGNGGAARACIYALKQAGAEVTIFARDLAKAKILADEFEVELKELTNADFNDFEIVVNATALGMKGVLENETPAVAKQIRRVKLVYDLVYNPCSTEFLKQAKSVFVPTVGGMAMLVAQAVKQFEIWTGKDAPIKEMSQAALKRLG